MIASGFVLLQVPKTSGLIFQLQHIEGTDVWVGVEKPELSELVRKARLYDITTTTPPSPTGARPERWRS